MKNKLIKVVAVFLCMFLYSGCDAEYKIEIKDNLVYETLTIYETSSTKLDQTGENSFKGLLNKAMETHTNTLFTEGQSFFLEEECEGDIFYDKAINQKRGYGIDISSYHTISTYPYTTIINSCYDEVEYTNRKAYGDFILETSKEFKCMNMFNGVDTVKIILINDYVITNHNADETIGNNTYIWNINKGNYKDKKILINSSNTKTLEDPPAPNIPDDYYGEEDDGDDYNSYEPDATSDNKNNQNGTDSESRSKTEEEISKEKAKISSTNNVVIIILIVLSLIVVISITMIYVEYKKNTRYK